MRRLVRFLVTLPFRFPVMVGSLASSAAVWWWFGWLGLAVLGGAASVASLVWWRVWPDSFRRWVTLRLLAWWRHVFVCRRHWQPVLVISGLAESYQERRYLPRIRRVVCTSWADRVRVTLVAGTSPTDFETRVAELAHGFGAPSCRVVVEGPRKITLEFPRHDTLAEPLDAFPMTHHVDLSALPVGVTEDGSQWRLRLHGTHVLVAGVTGSGKGPVIWSAIRAILPAVAEGMAQVWAIDPKRMELSYGRGLFARYADDGESAVAVLELAVSQMQDRARRYAGRQRSHIPTVAEPFVLVVLDEASQVDMILGEGARDRGANAHLIDPGLPGVGYVRMEGSPAPVRVRAAYVSDDDITTMTEVYGPDPSSDGGAS